VLPASFGARLRAAREARGQTIESCAQAIKLPVRVVRQLECDECDGIDCQVYLGSYICKYGRHLGIDKASIEAEVDRVCKRGEPELVATGGISHSRYLLERYATAATYVVLTAVIIVPVIWLGIRGTLNRDISRLAPLDAAPVAQQEVAAAGASSIGSGTPGVVSRAVQSAEADQQPLLASMVPSMVAQPAVAPTKPAAVEPHATQGAHSVSIDLGEASWVEVTAADGRRLEYSLLPGGSHRVYHSDKALDVRLGNASGATVKVDGAQVQLDPYRHANVAYFRVQAKDGKAGTAAL
jgi:cytoskeleton protein RodZ